MAYVSASYGDQPAARRFRRIFAREWLWLIACILAATVLLIGLGRSRTFGNDLAQHVRRELQGLYDDLSDETLAALVIKNAPNSALQKRIVAADGSYTVVVPVLGSVEFPANVSTTVAEQALRDELTKRRDAGAIKEPWRYTIAKVGWRAPGLGALLYGMVGLVRLTRWSLRAVKSG